MSLGPGAILSHYQLLEKIGEGGMGVVYRARDQRLDREVAIKIVRAPTAETAELGRLIREARTAAKIQHANVAGIFELDEADDRPFIVMELVRGRSLRQRLAGGPLPIAETLRILRALCAGLGAAHSLGVTHRDLKPENVVITDSGVVKILDFGVAIFRDPRSPDDVATLTRSPGLTRDRGISGTIPYMAPEQLSGGSVGPPSDIFSLGVVLHEMLTGRRPFQASTTATVIDAILHADPRPASGARPEVTAHLDRVVLKCLAKRPDDRYQSCDEITQALDTGARPTPARAAARRFGLALGLVVLAGAVTIATLRWGWRGAAVPGTSNNILTVAVAPFSQVGTGDEQRGRLVQKLIERELRQLAAQNATRLLEGTLTRPIQNEREAREACHRVEADLIVWGGILEAGQDAEMEVRLTLIRPLDKSAPFEALVGSRAGAMTGVVEDLALDSPGELQALKLRAMHVGDLVTTLAALGQLRSGDYMGTVASLSTISNPTSDQRFYLGIALLRAGQVAEAERTFDRVIQEAPDHVGARLGWISARAHSSPRPDRELVGDLLASGVEANPFDTRANLFLLHVVLRATFDPRDPTSRVVYDSLLHHVERIACSPNAGQIPESVLALVIVTALSASSPWSEGLDPGLERALTCPAAIDAFEQQPRFRLVACHTLLEITHGAAWETLCQPWRPDPMELDPIAAVAFLAESDDPEAIGKSLEELAARDPRRDERILSWAGAMDMAARPAAEIFDWLDAILDPPAARAEALVARGMILLRRSRPEEAERSLASAESVLGRREDLARFRCVGMMASGQFVEAAEYVGVRRVPERPLALAGAGRLSEAGHALWPEVDAPSEAGAVMRHLYDAMQERAEIREALSALFAERLRAAARAMMIEYYLGYEFKGTELLENPDGSFALPVRWNSSFGPELDFALPGDPLEVLHLLGELAETAERRGATLRRQEILDFSRELADEISRSHTTTKSRSPE